MKTQYLFIDISDSVHDASGITNPENYWWQRGFATTIFYPKEKITENEYHQEVRNWLSDNGYPEMSLDEIDVDDFRTEDLEHRKFFLELFDNLKS